MAKNSRRNVERAQQAKKTNHKFVPAPVRVPRGTPPICAKCHEPASAPVHRRPK